MSSTLGDYYADFIHLCSSKAIKLEYLANALRETHVYRRNNADLGSYTNIPYLTFPKFTPPVERDFLTCGGGICQS